MIAVPPSCLLHLVCVFVLTITLPGLLAAVVPDSRRSPAERPNVQKC